MTSANKILIIVTNVGEHGFDVDIASAKGGPVPIDPVSLAPEYLDESTAARCRDRDFINLLTNTMKAVDARVEDYNVLYFAGGHGVLFDFRDAELGALTAPFYESGRIVSAVCHGPAGLLNVPFSSGAPLVRGRNVTGFSWPEEEIAERADAVPFSLQDELRVSAPTTAPRQRAVAEAVVGRLHAR